MVRYRCHRHTVTILINRSRLPFANLQDALKNELAFFQMNMECLRAVMVKFMEDARDSRIHIQVVKLTDELEDSDVENWGMRPGGSAAGSKVSRRP